MLTDPVGALAKLQLARAQTAMGDKTKARASYRQFLELWNNADDALPLLVGAKEESAKLQQTRKGEGSL